MEYMLLLYGNEEQAANAGAAEKGQAFAEFAQVVQELTRNGQLKSTNPLQPTHAATTVRVRDGKRLTTDGPFAETKEQLGGYFVIDVKDLDEAIAIAARIPTSRYGSVEVRPIMKIPPMPPR
jgi:hypothetical protein